MCGIAKNTAITTRNNEGQRKAKLQLLHQNDKGKFSESASGLKSSGPLFFLLSPEVDRLYQRDQERWRANPPKWGVGGDECPFTDERRAFLDELSDLTAAVWGEKEPILTTQNKT